MNASSSATFSRPSGLAEASGLKSVIKRAIAIPTPTRMITWFLVCLNGELLSWRQMQEVAPRRRDERHGRHRDQSFADSDEGVHRSEEHTSELQSRLNL